MNVHPCPDWRELLSAYQDRQLSKNDSRRVEAHLASCTGCREALARWHADCTRYTDAYAGSTGGPNLRAAIMEEIRAMTPVPTLVSLSRSRYRWLLGFSAASAVGCVILGSLMALQFNFAGERTAIASLAPEKREVALAQPLTVDEKHKAFEQSPVDIPAGAPAPPMMAKAASPGAKRPDSGETDRLRSLGYLDGPGDAVAAAKPDQHVITEARTPAFKYEKKFASSPDEFAARNDTTLPVNGPALSRNYGVAGGVHMAYDVDYRVEVKDALKSARQAQDMVRGQGGFTTDFQFTTGDGALPTASFRGKIPADKADAVLGEFEKLGQVSTVNVAGEDLTWQYRDLENRMKYQTGAEKAATKRQYAELGLKENLVEFSASFTEPKPRERTTLASVARTTKDVLKYALLALLTLAVLLLGLALLISPFVLLVRTMKKRARDNRETEMPEPLETQGV